ncbi:hypothetical protein MNBD_CHLOROFLEXI01-678, partial [hydrothermal vent metagenome]
MRQQPSMKLLIGEQNPQLRGEMKRYLQERCGFEVTAVNAAENVLAALAEGEEVGNGRFHILLLSDSLPSLEADQLVTTVRQLMPQIKEQNPNLITLILSDDVLSAVALRRAGVFRQLSAHPQLQELGLAVQDCAEFLRYKQVALATQDEAVMWRREVRQQQSQIYSMRETTRAMTSQSERDELLCLILKKAVTLLGGKSGGIYEYDPIREELTMVVDYGRKNSKMRGSTLKKGEGMAGQLVASGEPHIIVPHYAEFDGKKGIYAEERPDSAVVEVLLRLKWQDHIVGVLYVDDEVGRGFTTEDAQMLQLFADQAAIAFANADLILRDHTKFNRLQKLSLAASQIMSKLGTVSQDEILNLIAKHATDILQAEAGSILLLRRPGFLSFEASYGYTDEGIQKGREFEIRSGQHSGLTGHIAWEKKLFNAHGTVLTTHPAVRGQESPYMKSRECYGMLAIPLLQQKGDDDESVLVGLLRLDNKKNGQGEIGPECFFTEEDEWIGRLFAETVVVAIESSRLVGEISEGKARYARLLETAVDGVITNDRQGKITFYNKQAEHIMGFPRSKMLGRPVSAIFANPQETRRILQALLLSPNGQLPDYETVVLDADNNPVPIRLSVTWQYDVHNEKTGVVGYFKDMRAVAETQRRLKLMVDASDLLAQADNLSVGLQDLAQMMAQNWGTTFCRIFLLDQEQRFLTTQAAYPLPNQEGGLNWQPGIGEQTAVSEWPRLDELIEEYPSSLIHLQGRRGRQILQKWSQRLQLEKPIQSLLVVPLRHGNRVVGLMDLGELREGKAAVFSNEMQDLAIAIAKQTAVLINRLDMYEKTRRRSQLLESLDETSRNIRGIKESPVLLREVIRLAAQLVNCDKGGLFLNSPQMGELTLSDVYGLPTELIGSVMIHSEGMIGQAARLNEILFSNQYDEWPNRAALWQPYNFATLVAIPLRHAGKVEAVLFVADQ